MRRRLKVIVAVFLVFLEKALMVKCSLPGILSGMGRGWELRQSSGFLLTQLSCVILVERRRLFESFARSQEFSR